MRACRSVGSVLSLVLPIGIAALVTGCQTETPAPPPPVSHRTATPVYDTPSQMQIDPGTKMGAVIAVDPRIGFAEIKVSQNSPEVKEGDTFVFTDHGQNVVCGGRVESVSPTDGRVFATIRYSVHEGGRAPNVDDYAFCVPNR